MLFLRLLARLPTPTVEVWLVWPAGFPFRLSPTPWGTVAGPARWIVAGTFQSRKPRNLLLLPLNLRSIISDRFSFLLGEEVTRRRRAQSGSRRRRRSGWTTWSRWKIYCRPALTTTGTRRGRSPDKLKRRCRSTVEASFRQKVVFFFVVWEGGTLLAEIQGFIRLW